MNLADKWVQLLFPKWDQVAQIIFDINFMPVPLVEQYVITLGKTYIFSGLGGTDKASIPILEPIVFYLSEVRCLFNSFSTSCKYFLASSSEK